MIIVDIRPEIVNAIIILIQGYFARVVITPDGQGRGMEPQRVAQVLIYCVRVCMYVCVCVCVCVFE